MPRPKGRSTGRERLIEAAAKTFRENGFAGAGVDGVAQAAGLTSGAFYAHFGSKANAFRMVISDGLRLLRDGIEEFKRVHGDAWLSPFLDFYFGARLAADLSDACALATFTTDAIRADPETQQVYQKELSGIAAAIATGLSGNDRTQRAWTLMAVLSGGAGMIRAMPDPKLKAEIAEALKASAKAK